MTPALWSYSDLVTVMRARLMGAPRVAVRGISIDSRTVQPGDLFVAIQGENFDGHDFVRAALTNGAAAAVVADGFLALDGGPYLVTPDPLAALVELGRAARARSNAQIVAVTGSVGKTGTKEMLAAALARSGESHASVASYNNHWGVPLTLARMPQTSRFGVFEIGMNHSGEITPLTTMVRPHVAVVTTVEPVHLEFFPNVEAIADAKAEIFDGLQPGGAAVINHDNPYCARLRARAEAAGARIVTFGAHPEFDCRLIDVVLQPTFSTASATIFGTPVAYKLGAPGRHVVQNSLAALGAAVVAGGDLALAALAIGSAKPPKGRGERQTLVLPKGGAFTLVDESYNANPASMRAALALLGDAAVGRAGRRIAVLGDMRELGPSAEELHAKLAPVVESARIDVVHCCGPHMRRLFERLPEGRRGAYAEAAAGIESAVIEQVAPGDVVMVKGSLGTRMGPIVEAFRARYPSADQPAADEGA